MNVLIVGCGWVGTYVATKMLEEGQKVWATCTSLEKKQCLERIGLIAEVIDFDREGRFAGWDGMVFDAAIISVPIRRKDSIDAVESRFTHLISFLKGITFKQSLFFGSVGIYPKVSAIISEDTFSDSQLNPKLLLGETKLVSTFPELNVLRLGGLFGLDRIMAKYFVGKPCEIGHQTANAVHVVDVNGIVQAMIACQSKGEIYNVVCPEHPLKKDVIQVSAEKYGYGLPSAFLENDKTAKRVSPERLVTALGYRFRYASPLAF